MQALLVDLQFEAVHALGERGETFPDARLAAPQLRQLSGQRSALGLGGGELRAGLRQRPVDGVEHGGQLRGDARGHLPLCAPHDGPTSGGGRCLALPLTLTLQSDDSAFAGADPLTQGLDVESCPHLSVARRLQCGEQIVSGRGVQDGSRRLERDGEPILG